MKKEEKRFDVGWIVTGWIVRWPVRFILFLCRLLFGGSAKTAVNWVWSTGGYERARCRMMMKKIAGQWGWRWSHWCRFGLCLKACLIMVRRDDRSRKNVRRAGWWRKRMNQRMKDTYRNLCKRVKRQSKWWRKERQVRAKNKRKEKNESDDRD